MSAIQIALLKGAVPESRTSRSFTTPAMPFETANLASPPLRCVGRDNTNRLSPNSHTNVACGGFQRGTHMNVFAPSLLKGWARRRRVDINWMEEFGRNARTFDVEAIAPYDHKGLVAFLKAEKLNELSARQIRVYLMLRDNPKLEGYTASHIAVRLELGSNTVRSCLSVLKREGYAMHSPMDQRDDRGRKIVTWIYDPDHCWSNDGDLFWEFGKLY